MPKKDKKVLDRFGVVWYTLDMSKTKDVHIFIDAEKYEALKRIAEASKRKLTAVIDIAFEQYLKRRNWKK